MTELIIPIEKALDTSKLVKKLVGVTRNGKTYQAMRWVRLHEADSQESQEPGDGEGCLLAPNGKPSHLNEKQWHQVRTPEFKAWFGDWELSEKKVLLTGPAIKKIKSGVIRGDENTKPIEAALKWAKKNIQESVDTVIGKIIINGQGVRDSLSHGFSQKKLDSIQALPDVLKSGILLDSVPDYKGKQIVNHFFAAPIELDNERNILFVRVRGSGNGKHFYVHEIFLEREIKELETHQTIAESEDSRPHRGLKLYKNILQKIYAVNPNSVSKIVDGNGEPLVVYKGMMKNDWKTKKEIESIDSPNGPWAGFFTNSKDVAEKFQRVFSTMGEAALHSVYLSIQNPYVYDAGGSLARESMFDNAVFAAFDQEYDGAIIKNTADEGTIYVPKNPNQIKSIDAMEFDPNSPNFNKSLDRSKLVKKPVMVIRNGRSYQATRWVAEEHQTNVRPNGENKDIKTLISNAFEIGQKAFHDGKRAVPYEDKAVMDLIAQSKNHQETIDILKAWQKGWMKENIVAPWEKSLTFSGHKLQGRRKVQGMDISVENKKGTTRRGKDKDGHEWATKMHADYGYIRGTVGKDKDHVDTYVGPNPDSTKVFIIHQNNPVKGTYDEDKVMLGFDTAKEAKALYLKQYDRPGFFGSMDETDIDTFKEKAFADKNKGKKLVVAKSRTQNEERRGVRGATMQKRLFIRNPNAVKALLTKAQNSKLIPKEELADTTATSDGKKIHNGTAPEFSAMVATSRALSEPELRGYNEVGRQEVEAVMSMYPDEMEIGEKVEMEHTVNLEIARMIAADHLLEDHRYYTKLIAAGLVDEAEVNAAKKDEKPMGKGLPLASDNAHRSAPKWYPESKKEYADPNNYKYPLDTEEHVRAAISYFSQPKNYSLYSPEERRVMWARITRAAKKHGIEISEKEKFGKAMLVIPRFAKALNTSRLVKRPVNVNRGGKIIQQHRWVRPDEENGGDKSPRTKDGGSGAIGDSASGQEDQPKRHIHVDDKISYNANGKTVTGTASKTGFYDGVIVKDATGKEHPVEWKDIARPGTENSTTHPQGNGTQQEDPEEVLGSKHGYGMHRINTGDTVAFKSDGETLKGTVVDESQKDGVIVETSDGRNYNVKWRDITYFEGAKQDNPQRAEHVDKAPEDTIDPRQFVADRWAQQFDDPKVTANEILDEMEKALPDVRQEIAKTEDRLKNLEQTISRYRIEGEGASSVYSQAREAKHKAILDEMFSQERIASALPPESEKPVFIMLGGRGGSGKSWFDGKVYDRNRAIVLDADEIKAKLDEYEGWNAAQVHEESSDILEKALVRAREMGLNVVLDATMKSANKALAKVDSFKEAGYSIEAHYMYCPRPEAAKRAVARFMGKMRRYVPVEVILANTTNERSFDEVRKHVDAWSFRNSYVKDQKGDPSVVSEQGERQFRYLLKSILLGRMTKGLYLKRDEGENTMDDKEIDPFDEYDNGPVTPKDKYAPDLKEMMGIDKVMLEQIRKDKAAPASKD